ncbi:MAG: hypothetical protein K6A28_01715 [Bacteroidales bacterium]|nr:hypothetical protein [Bacteroidales bacterium]
MKRTIIISAIALYWIAALVWWYCTVYRSRKKLGLPLPLENKFKIAAFQYVVYFITPLLLPFHLIIKLFDEPGKMRFKNDPNMPGPLPQGARYFLRADRVVDRTDDNYVMSLEEYNEKHHTQYRYKDIYGRRYVKKYLDGKDLEF